ncbi:hypothetical protein [Flavobacterium sp.]
MKIFKLCLFVITFFISCSDVGESSYSPHEYTSGMYSRDAITSPSNTKNPYDYVGRIHNEVLDAYFAADSLPFTFSTIVNEVVLKALANVSFSNLNSIPYSLSSSIRIYDIAADSTICQAGILTQSIGGTKTRIDFAYFLDEFFIFCDEEDDYGLLYNFIVSYEDAVLYDAFISENDRKVILKSTSIARYSAYARKKKPKKNKDPEWAWMVGNVFAGIEGAAESDQDAIIKSLAVGILANQ